MTIFEQILAGLQQKFPGADTATLTRIATKKAEGVTDETKVNSIVEGISFSDVLNNYGDFRAGQAQVSAVTNYEKKHGLKDGKPIENPNPEPPKPEPKPDEKPDIAKLIADGIAAGIKPFSDKLGGKAASEYALKSEVLSAEDKAKLALIPLKTSVTVTLSPKPPTPIGIVIRISTLEIYVDNEKIEAPSEVNDSSYTFTLELEYLTEHSISVSCYYRYEFNVNGTQYEQTERLEYESLIFADRKNKDLTIYESVQL